MHRLIGVVALTSHLHLSSREVLGQAFRLTFVRIGFWAHLTLFFPTVVACNGHQKVHLVCHTRAVYHCIGKETRALPKELNLTPSHRPLSIAKCVCVEGYPPRFQESKQWGLKPKSRNPNSKRRTLLQKHQCPFKKGGRKVGHSNRQIKKVAKKAQNRRHRTSATD